MKSLFYLLLLSPLWAALATRLALQVLISSIACVIFLTGLLRGVVIRKNNAIGLAAMAIQFLLYAAGLWFANWFFESSLSVCDTRDQKTVFWIVAILFCLVYLREMFQKIKQNWRFAHVLGAAEEYAWERKAGLVK